MNTEQAIPGKPIPLRIIFILNAIMMVLPFVFYAIFTIKEIQVEGLNPVWMVYTGFGYMVSFVALVTCILKKNIMGVRVVIICNVLISIPAKAYIGIAVAIVSMLLSFNGQVKGYFSYRYTN